MWLTLLTSDGVAGDSYLVPASCGRTEWAVRLLRFQTFARLWCVRQGC